MRVISIVAGCVLPLALAGTPETASAQGLMLTGYADFEARYAKAGPDNSEFFFDNYHFNLIAMGKLYKNLFASGEVEYEHAGEEIMLEYAFLSYTGFKNIRISAGKFIVPFGRFNKDLHPTWINKMPDRPLGMDNVFPQTYSDVGIWISGAAAVSGGTRIVYDAFVVNGLLGEDGGDIRDLRDNDREGLSAGGRDNNKAFGGRLGVELGPQGLDVGASVYTGNYFDDPTDNLTLTLFGADAAYAYKGLEVRAEAVFASQDATAGDLKKKGGYAQAAYLVRGRFEPVIRFSLKDMPGENNDQRRLSFGGNYYVSANSSVRLAYHVNMEQDAFASENNAAVAQFNIMF
jgi:hypothetical protein